MTESGRTKYPSVEESGCMLYVSQRAFSFSLYYMVIYFLCLPDKQTEED